MVGEMQPFLSVYPNRNKEHLNINVGSESSISLLRKFVLSIQNYETLSHIYHTVLYTLLVLIQKMKETIPILIN